MPSPFVVSQPIVDPVAVASSYTNKMIARRGAYSWLSMVQQGFVDVAIENIAKPLLNRQKPLLIRSLIGIEERWKLAIEMRTATKQMAQRNIDRLSESSINESYRQVFLAQQLREAAKDDQTQVYAMMLSTTADEPDDEHAHLEGEVLPLEEVIEHLQRFGCQHTYKIVSKTHYEDKERKIS